MKSHRLTETDIRRQIQEYLRMTGWFVYYNLAGLGSFPGLSDLVAIKNGRTVHIEVKTPRGRQSERQKQFQQRLEESGGEYLIAKSLDDVMNIDREVRR